MDAVAAPGDTYNDNDSLGDDKEAAKSYAQYVDGADGAENSTWAVRVMEAGTPTEYIELDGKNVKIDIFKPIALGANGLATTGIISHGSQTPLTGDADLFDDNFTGAYLYGGTYICNGAGTAILPLMAVGMNFTIITLGAIAVVIDTNINDGYLADGTTGVEGAQLTNTSTAGNMAVIQYYTTDDWLITTDGWTPG